MQSPSLSARAIASMLSLSLLASVACETAPTADGIVQTRVFDGTTLFEGIVLGAGPVAALFPEITDVETDHLSDEEREELAAWLAGAEITDADVPAILAAYDADPDARRLRAEIIARVDAEDPEFLDRFGAAMYSGDHVAILAGLDDAFARVRRATASQAPSAPDDLKVPLVKPASSLWLDTYGVAINFWAFIAAIFWWGGEGVDPEQGRLARERTAALIADRLAIAP